MKLTLVKGSLDDWFLIERAEHDGRKWLQPTTYGTALMYSARISDADVEGTGEDMLQIADAIEKRGRFSARRCSVQIRGQSAFFRSPRNSQVDGECTLDEADDLARLIRETVKP